MSGMISERRTATFRWVSTARAAIANVPRTMFAAPSDWREADSDEDFGPQGVDRRVGRPEFDRLCALRDSSAVPFWRGRP